MIQAHICNGTVSHLLNDLEIFEDLSQTQYRASGVSVDGLLVPDSKMEEIKR